MGKASGIGSGGDVGNDDQRTGRQRFAYRMKEAVELANNRIHQHAKDHPEVRGMGTTATVAGVFGADLYLAQVGDPATDLPIGSSRQNLKAAVAG